jgi:hypothetical protein
VSLALNGLDFSNNSASFLFFEMSEMSIAKISPDRFDSGGTTRVTVSGVGLIPGSTAVLRFQSGTLVATASFNMSTPGSVVAFAPEFCAEWHWSMTYCKVHATGPVLIDATLDGQFYSSTQLAGSYFKQPKPLFLSVNLGPVDGSTLVTIRGTGFADTGLTKCRFGTDDTPRAAIFLSESEMACLTPTQSTAVNKHVQLTFDGQTWIQQLSFEAYRFIHTPTVTSVTPDSTAWSSAPINVTASGTSFPVAEAHGTKHLCRFGAIEMEGIRVEADSVQCLTPPNVYMEGSVEFAVSFNGLDWHKLPSGFSFTTPAKCWSCADVVAPSVTRGPLCDPSLKVCTRRRRYTIRDNSAAYAHPTVFLVLVCFIGHILVQN